jgi:hypothetical protein
LTLDAAAIIFALSLIELALRFSFLPALLNIYARMRHFRRPCFNEIDFRQLTLIADSRAIFTDTPRHATLF